MPDFQLWLKKLESLGYVNRWALLNAKDIGMEGTGPVPQNRLRVFCLSMRKDCAFDYQFPEPMPLEKRLEDILEPEVDEKYFLKDDAVSKFLKANDNDKALFHQFALPPTHEDAMFLKTWLQDFFNEHDLWECTPTELDDLLTSNEKHLLEDYKRWKEGNPMWPEFDALFEENMKRNQNNKQ